MRASVDAGPIIHLEEIQLREPWDLFDELFLPEPVADEVSRQPDEPGAALLKTGGFDIIRIGERVKDHATWLSIRNEISFADGSVLAVAKQRTVPLVLTDDLDVRDAAKMLGVRPVGTIGLVIRAAKHSLLSRAEALEKLSLLEGSSLFVTPDLLDRSKRAIDRLDPSGS